MRVFALTVLMLAATVTNAFADSGIAWFGTWSQALREAARTNRPILLISGAPHCHEVPGIW